jgi:hypothetical protein
LQVSAFQQYKNQTPLNSVKNSIAMVGQDIKDFYPDEHSVNQPDSDLSMSRQPVGQHHSHKFEEKRNAKKLELRGSGEHISFQSIPKTANMNILNSFAPVNTISAPKKLKDYPKLQSSSQILKDHKQIFSNINKPQMADSKDYMNSKRS